MLEGIFFKCQILSRVVENKLFLQFSFKLRLRRSLVIHVKPLYWGSASNDLEDCLSIVDQYIGHLRM